jgi:hypothetical protein
LLFRNYLVSRAWAFFQNQLDMVEILKITVVTGADDNLKLISKISMSGLTLEIGQIQKIVMSLMGMNCLGQQKRSLFSTCLSTKKHPWGSYSQRKSGNFKQTAEVVKISVSQEKGMVADECQLFKVQNQFNL